MQAKAVNASAGNRAFHSGCLLASVVLCCLALVNTAIAQQVLHGSVVDASGAAIQDVRIVVSRSERTLTVTTDAAGKFSVLLPGSGSGDLLASAPGFQTQRLPLTDQSENLFLSLSVAQASEEIVVTPGREGIARADTSSTVSVLDSSQISSAAAATLDAKLQQVAGFTLFRRSDSRAINPTAQGVSLRGIGSSGASRTLVTEDGVPLNDPFGGWVYFDRVPQMALGRVEVLQGGVSELYGSGAMGGVIDLVPRDAEAPLYALDLSGGNLGTLTGSGIISNKWRKWTASTAVEGFRNDGYIEVAPRQRGSVDVPANLRYGSGDFRIGHPVGAGRAFGEFNLLDDARSNGTREQFNDLRLWSLSAGLDLLLQAGLLTVRGYGDAQSYNQTFSAIE